MKRVTLFVLANLAMMLTATVAFHAICVLLGVDGRFWLSSEGIDATALAVYACVFGMGGAFVSLLLSKPIAKLSVRARVIDGDEGVREARLVSTVRRLAERAGVKMPEVAIYEGAPNAFATGAFRDSSLVAVSTGLLDAMDSGEVEAVLGHEMSHVANGDMVTMTLVQGVLNACVIALSRVIAAVADGALGGDRKSSRRGPVYWIAVHVLDVVLGLGAALVTCAYSRRREFAADAGSAALLGSPAPMMRALAKLGGCGPGDLPDSLRALGATGRAERGHPFATHPPIEARLDALRNWRPA